MRFRPVSSLDKCAIATVLLCFAIPFITTMKVLGSSRDDSIKISPVPADDRSGGPCVENRKVYDFFEALLEKFNSVKKRDIVEDIIDVKGIDCIFISPNFDRRKFYKEYCLGIERRRKNGDDVSEKVSLNGNKISIKSESIDWLVPYLKPSGFFLELCDHRVEITSGALVIDTAFWDNFKEVFEKGGILCFKDIGNDELSKVAVKAGELSGDLAIRQFFAECRAAAGKVYEYHQMRDEAERAYRDAIWLDDMLEKAYVELSNILIMNGREKESLEIMKKYLKKDPANTGVSQYVTLLEMEIERKQLFEQLKSDLLSSEECDWEKYLAMADKWEKAKDYQFVNLIYSALLSREDCNDAEMFEKIGKSFQRQKRFDEMVIAYSRGLALAELDKAKEAEFNLQVAVGLILKGRHKDAMKYIETAYKADKAVTKYSLANDKYFDPMRLNEDSNISERVKELLEGK